MQKLLVITSMKKIPILFLLFTSFAFSQEKTVDIDYIVDYVVPKKRALPADTISIGFNKDGRYVWTNYNKLALGLARSLIKNSSEDYTKAKSNIIYDTKDGSLLLTFEFKENLIFFNLNIETFLPPSPESDSGLGLITEDVGETIEIIDREANLHNIFPGDQPNDVLTVATDQEYKVNNSKVFKKLFEIAFGMSDLTDDSTPQIPEGLILKVIEKERTLLEAIKVNTTKKTIKINYSFKITE